MIMQADAYYVRSCPVCGRPLRISLEHRGERVMCQHCRGQFVAGGSCEESRTTDRRIDEALTRADRFLARPSAQSCSKPRNTSCQAIRGVCSPGSGRPKNHPQCTTRVDRRPKSHARREAADSKNVQTVLIVEYRDAVFERLASAFRQIGMRVSRAMCGFEAMGQYIRTRPNLVVANVDMPGQSGWLLTAKLRIVESTPHVWLYTSRKTAKNMSMAKFVRAEELLEYGSNLSVLSDAVFSCLAGESPATRTFQEPWIATVSRAV